MKRIAIIGCIIGSVFLVSLPIYADNFVTSSVLSFGDVEPFVKKYIESRRGAKFSHIMGIYQGDDNKKLAKVFFKYNKKGRSGDVLERGEVNCFHVNSGKWYCGGGYDFLTK